MAKHHRLIQNYGLFWDREKVVWGRDPKGGKDAARLPGVVKAKDTAVDFREQAGIYALYDEEFRLIYAGQAGTNKQGKGRLFDRLKHHTTVRAGTRRLATRWRYFSWFGLVRVLKGEQTLAKAPGIRQTTPAQILDALEAVAIEIADPDLNRQGGRLGGSTEYLQFPLDGAVKAAVKSAEARPASP